MLQIKTGIDLESTLKNLDQMSQAILASPDLMNDAERADQMLLTAIHAKMEIINMF